MGGGVFDLKTAREAAAASKEPLTVILNLG
jgi:hypothetical protein